MALVFFCRVGLSREHAAAVPPAMHEPTMANWPRKARRSTSPTPFPSSRGARVDATPGGAGTTAMTHRCDLDRAVGVRTSAPPESVLRASCLAGVRGVAILRRAVAPDDQSRFDRAVSRQGGQTSSRIGCSMSLTPVLISGGPRRAESVAGGAHVEVAATAGHRFPPPLGDVAGHRSDVGWSASSS